MIYMQILCKHTSYNYPQRMLIVHRCLLWKLMTNANLTLTNIKVQSHSEDNKKSLPNWKLAHCRYNPNLYISNLKEEILSQKDCVPPQYFKMLQCLRNTTLIVNITVN